MCSKKSVSIWQFAESSIDNYIMGDTFGVKIDFISSCWSPSGLRLSPFVYTLWRRHQPLTHHHILQVLRQRCRTGSAYWQQLHDSLSTLHFSCLTMVHWQRPAAGKRKIIGRLHISHTKPPQLDPHLHPQQNRPTSSILDYSYRQTANRQQIQNEMEKGSYRQKLFPSTIAALNNLQHKPCTKPVLTVYSLLCVCFMSCIGLFPEH